MQAKKLLHLGLMLSLWVLMTSLSNRTAQAQDAAQPVWPTKEWLSSTPEEQGMDSSELATLVDFGGNHSFDSLLVVRHGRIVTEATYASYTADIPHDIHSCTKAIIGTVVGPTPEIASSTSGKTYKFPDNALKLRSLSLFLTAPHPHVEFETYAHDSATSSVKYDEPIGLDGLYSMGLPLKSGPAAGYITATRGTWLNGQRFVVDLRVPAFGVQRKYLLTFSGEKLHLRFEDGDGRVVSVDGEQGDNLTARR